MIISHKHKFIFLKSTKTAGTSIEIALSRHCGPDDILTPLWPDEEALRLEMGGVGAQNHQLPLNKHRFSHRMRIRFQGREQMFYGHAKASEIQPYVSPQQWNSYYKFVVARNPWGRVISQYHFDFRKKVEPVLSDYINRKKLGRINRRGWGLYTINGKPVVDKICRFENLSNDLEEVRLAIGLPEPIELPRAKGEYSVGKPHYREILNSQQKDLIAKEFCDEIAALNYEF